MKVSYQWLKEYVNLDGVSPLELAEKLTNSGIEVEVVEVRNLGVSQTVVGYVTERDAHPNADKLSVCRVDVGHGELLQIVCGAKNVAAGQKVAVALVGATLPGGMEIKHAKLRDVESHGMICSAKELGINDKLLPKEQQEGILVLPQDSEIGSDVVALLGLDDTVLELSLTPNRSDCLSMIGVAYEVAAILGREVKNPDAAVSEQVNGMNVSEKVSVAIDAPDHCYRYTARLITGLALGSSPLWMQNRLIAAGIRPINNIVDITNYVMLELGQPLHAFDYEQVNGGRIVVRLADEGESFATLDDVTRKLDGEMLLITDGVKPIGIAGVMGGANSEVTEKTTTVLLESAHFSGVSIRKTARKLGLRSEASLRFEKEVDPERVVRALDRASLLLSQLAGGKVQAGIAEAVHQQRDSLRVDLHLSRLNRFLGMELSTDTIAGILNRLQFPFEQQAEDGGDQVFQVLVPTRRQDITLEEDLFEEVARLYGYDYIPTTLPDTVTTPGRLTREQQLRRVVRRTLNSVGMQEAVTYSLTNPVLVGDVEGVFGTMESTGLKAVSLALPMSEERSVLRTNLLPHLIEAAAYNRNRRNENVAIYEIGSIFLSTEEKITRLPDEWMVLAGLLTGNLPDAQWLEPARPVDFYLAKGTLDALFGKLRVGDVEYRAATALKGMHPGRTAEIFVEGEKIGYIGQLHPEVQKKYDVAETFVFQLDAGKLFAHVKMVEPFRPLPKFPAIQRDLAVVIGTEAAAGLLTAKIKEAGGKWLESVELFDVYTGEGIGAGLKSLAFSLTYRDPEKTLTDEEVNGVHGEIVRQLESAFGAKLRGE